MNNPVSPHPAHALFPSPPNCTGARVHAMLAARTGATREDYLKGFDRFNVMVGEWDAQKAASFGRELWTRLAGRAIVLLGQEVLRTVGQHEKATAPIPPLRWASGGGRGWILLPHPSGRNHWYNTPANKLGAELLLEELYVTMSLEHLGADAVARCEKWRKKS